MADGSNPVSAMDTGAEPASTVIAFVDSRAAVAHLQAKRDDLKLVSDNPLLANAPECREIVTDISPLLDQSEATRIGEGAVDILLALDRLLVESGTTQRFGGVPHSLHVTQAMRPTVSTYLLRGLAAARAMEKTGGRSALLAVTDTRRWSSALPFQMEFYGSPHRSLAGHGFFGDEKVETVIVPAGAPEAFNDTSIDSLALRIAVAPAGHVLFHLADRLKLARLARGRPLYYGKRCEMLDETLPWLVLRGFHMEQSEPPGYPRAEGAGFDDKPAPQPELETVVLDWLTGQVAGLCDFTSRQSEAVARAIFDHLAAGLAVLPETRVRLEAWADRLAAAKAAGFLTSGVYGPRGVLLHDVLKKRGVPLIDFEHGVTTGIAKTSDRRLAVSEATTCDLLMACSERSKGRFESAPGKTARTIAVVGNADQARRLMRPRLQRSMARKRLGLGKSERAIIHVSTLLYGGTARAADDAPWEQEVYRVDRMLIEKVYANVPATVLFKPYPVQRFPDEAPYDRLFDCPPNLRFVGFEDFRYLRAASDVIVTQANSSTIGWCVAGDRPLIHLHSRGMNSLTGDDLIAAFADAFFFVDTDKADWPEELVRLLTRHPDELMAGWISRAPARARLLETALAGPRGSTGRRAAHVIARELHS